MRILTEDVVFKENVLQRLEVAEAHQVGRVHGLRSPDSLLLLRQVLSFVVVKIEHVGQDPVEGGKKHTSLKNTY